MKVLLHCCCAVCTIGPLRELTQQGHKATGYFFNPNIHPLIEFRRRLKAQKVLQERLGIEMIYVEDYGLREYLAEVDWRGPDRCADCYRLRLGRAAGEARARRFDAFATTLMTSTHQDHETLRRIGEQCAQAQGVRLLYRDWRPLADENNDRAKQLGLYRQQYCGCIFSEYERFRNTTRHQYRPGGQ